MQDVFPNQPGGWRILKTPTILKVLCDDPADSDDAAAYAPLPEDERPGGFDWGNQEERRAAEAGDEEDEEEEEHPHRD